VIKTNVIAGTVHACTDLFRQHATAACLVEMVAGVADPYEYASIELANRGLDIQGQYVGVSRAHALHTDRMARRAVRNPPRAKAIR
jgi:hypothetical protein